MTKLDSSWLIHSGYQLQLGSKIEISKTIVRTVFHSVMGQNPGIDTKLRYFSEKKFRAFEFFHCARGVLRLVSGVRKDP